MKLLIAIPTTDQMPYQFVESLTKLIKRLDADEVDYEVKFQSGTLAHVGRDKLALKAMTGGFTHVLWLDSDMVFTEDLFSNLWDARKDFVTGIAHARREPHQSCIFTELYPSIQRWQGEYPNNLFKIAGCGMACVLMNVDVIRDVWEHHSTAFFPSRDLGEDLAFCKRAKDLGHEIWAEPIVKLGHVGHLVIYPDYEERFRKSMVEV
jgi:hypothetical protein